MICDVIVSWPINCDYPLWRQFIRDNRTKLTEIIIAFTQIQGGGVDYRDFIKEAMQPDYVHFLDAPTPRGDEDWRTLAINASLLHSYNAPWVWFTEQDFYPKEGFWDEVEKYEAEGADVIAVYQGSRMHPCCIFVKREVLNKTHKDFGIIRDVADHFCKIQTDLENAKANIKIIDPKYYYHHNGLSSNWSLLNDNQPPNYQPDIFKKWLDDCLRVRVPIDDRFVMVAKKLI